MKIEQEEWKNFFRLKKSVLFLLVLAMVSSALYVVYLERMQQLPSEYLTSYLKEGKTKWEIQYFIFVFWGYFKRCLFVWLLGVFTFMTPISLMLVFIYIFSYGFSITWLYVTLGIAGMSKALFVFGIQGVLMIMCLLYLVSGILERNRVFGEKLPFHYTSYIFKGSLICGLVTLFEMLAGM